MFIYSYTCFVTQFIFSQSWNNQIRRKNSTIWTKISFSFNPPVSLSCSTFSSSSKLSDFFSSSDSDRFASPYNTHTHTHTQMQISSFLCIFYPFLLSYRHRKDYRDSISLNHETECKHIKVCCIQCSEDILWLKAHCALGSHMITWLDEEELMIWNNQRACQRLVIIFILSSSLIAVVPCMMWQFGNFATGPGALRWLHGEVIKSKRRPSCGIYIVVDERCC